MWYQEIWVIYSYKCEAWVTIPKEMNEWCFLGITYYYGNNDFIVWQIWRMIGSYIATPPRKQKLNDLIHGGFGSTSGHNLYIGTQNGSKLEVWQRGLIHASVKVMVLWSFPILYLYREAIRLQCFPPTHTHNRDDLYPICSNCNVGSLVALYGSTVHPGAIPSYAVLHTEKLAFSVQHC